MGASLKRVTRVQCSWIFTFTIFGNLSHGYPFSTKWLPRDHHAIPANSHACGLKTSISRPLTPADQFLTPDWKMWVVAVLLDTISKNSDPCKERKPCVKWINDNTFLAISDFVDKRFLNNFAFCRLRTSSEDFGLLRESSEMIVSFSKIPALPG